MMKINKCVLSLISVLPQSRRSSGISGGFESSSILGRSQTTSQLRPQQSQLSFSQGASSQHGLFSQFSQNSQEENLTNEKVVSQERENSARRTSSLPPINYAREESQMVVSRTSSNLMRRWSGQENKCHISEELKHRIGMIETSLSRFGMILDSVQSDIMLANKCAKEVALETKDVRQKLNTHDDTLQLMSKGQEDIKTCLDMGMKSLSEQLEQILNQENSGQIISSLSALSEKIDTQMVELQNGLHKDFLKEIQGISCKLKKMSTQKQSTPSIQAPKAHPTATAVSCRAPPLEAQVSKNATRQLKPQQKSLALKIEMDGWTTVKQKGAIPKVRNLNKRNNNKKVSPDQSEFPFVMESDEEIDGGFSCLFEEKRTAKDVRQKLNTHDDTLQLMNSQQENLSSSSLMAHATDLKFDENECMHILGIIQGLQVFILIDCGASQNFISPKIVELLGIPVDRSRARTITLADGRTVQDSGTCSISLTLDETPFVIDAIVFPIQPDILLGMQFLVTLGDVKCNFATRTMIFVRDRKEVRLQGVPGLQSFIHDLKNEE